MKTVLIFMFLAMGFAAKSAPVLNENSAFSDYVTVYKDSLDPNVYFYAPNHMTVCRSKEGNPRIRVIDLPLGSGSTHLMVLSTMCLGYHEGLQAALDSIRKLNPNARFAGVAFSGSKMILKSNVLSALIYKSDCDHAAGVIGAEHACSFTFNSRGRRVFKETLDAGLAVLLKFEYTIKGVDRNAAGGFDNSVSIFTVAGRIDGTDIPKAPGGKK